MSEIALTNLLYLSCYPKDELRYGVIAVMKKSFGATILDDKTQAHAVAFGDSGLSVLVVMGMLPEVLPVERIGHGLTCSRGAAIKILANGNITKASYLTRNGNRLKNFWRIWANVQLAKHWIVATTKGLTIKEIVVGLRRKNNQTTGDPEIALLDISAWQQIVPVGVV